MTDSGKRGWGVVGIFLAFSAAMIGCGAREQTAEQTVSVDGILVCGETPEAKVAHGRAPREWYSAFAMDNKLRNFPDFAEFAGMDAVTNCEEARLFFDRYIAYGEIHPHFDQQEPLPKERVPIPALPENLEPPDHVEVQKLKNGTGDRLSPVVGLSYTVPGFDPTFCTGSFIAKNWIMTAAHCLQVAPGWNFGQPEADAKIHAWYEWKVSVAGPQGIVAGDVRTFKYVLQYMDPRYVGFRSGHDAPFDFALLYVIDTDDGRLPNNIPNAGGSNIPYMRVSLRVGVNSSSTIWGMGQPDPSTLMRGSITPYNIAIVFGPRRPLYEGTVPSGGGVAYVCEGDSGGPIADRYDIENPQTGIPAPQYVAAATLSEGTEHLANPCSDQTGDTVSWVRTAEERDFIGISIADWYPFFTCKEKKSRNAMRNDYLECFGNPCQADADCAIGESCKNPGSQLSSCIGCASGGCDCIFGQCFKSEP